MRHSRSTQTHTHTKKKKHVHPTRPYRTDASAAPRYLTDAIEPLASAGIVGRQELAQLHRQVGGRARLNPQNRTKWLQN